MTPALELVVSALDRLTARASLPYLYELLRSCPASVQEVVAGFHPGGSQTCLLAKGEWYAVILSRWPSGQGSTIHHHAGSSSAFMVLHGACTETIFGYMAGGGVYPVESQVREIGSVGIAQDSDVHQLSNLQIASEDLIILQIDSPPLVEEHGFRLLRHELPFFDFGLDSTACWELQSGEGI